MSNSSPDASSPLSAPSPLEAPVDAAVLRRKARLGVITLALRTVVVQLTVLGGNVFLFRLLQPAHFGAFAIVQFALAFLLYFGDAGLGAALIQKQEEPSQRELSSVWLLQLGVSVAIVVFVGATAPLLIRFWPDMDASGAWLLRALSLQLLLTALRVVPAILMERNLQYTRLAILDVVLSVGFYAGAVALASAGFGVMALIGGVLIQGSLGVVCVFVMRPWRPSLVFDWKVVRPLMRFGVLFQAKNILGFVTGAIAPVYAGHALGQRALGLINWAQNTAFFPLQLVNIVSRINFPLYSRLQSQKEVFADVLARSVQLTAMATLMFCGIAAGLGPKLVIVVFTDKWLPALPLLYVYLGGIAIGFLSPVVATALDAAGRADLTFRFSVFVVFLTWTLVPLGTYLFGMLGFTIAYAAVMWIANPIMIYLLRKVAPKARLARRTLASAMAAMLSGVCGYYLRGWVTGWITLVASILLLILVFAGCMALLDRHALVQGYRMLRKKPAPEAGAPPETSADSPPD